MPEEKQRQAAIVRIPKDIYKKARKIAIDQNRNFNDVVNELVREFVAEQEQKFPQN